MLTTHTQNVDEKVSNYQHRSRVSLYATNIPSQTSTYVYINFIPISYTDYVITYYSFNASNNDFHKALWYIALYVYVHECRNDVM